MKRLTGLSPALHAMSRKEVAELHCLFNRLDTYVATVTSLVPRPSLQFLHMTFELQSSAERGPGIYFTT